MLAAFIITFRETLEIAIIVTIILAATKAVPGRGRWILAGIGLGLVGSSVIALFASEIADALEGMGQELFNAAILGVAVLMIVWTVVWMQSHGRAISQKMKEVGKAVSAGEVPLYSIAVVVSLAMWREGAEIVLFMTGIINTSAEPAVFILAGGLAGSVAAGIIGVLIYFGLLKLSSKYLFRVTGWLLILLACGMSAQMASYLSAADILPALGQTWDSSEILSQSSILGKVLHAMIGYSERPSGLQAGFYLITMFITLGLVRIMRSKKA